MFFSFSLSAACLNEGNKVSLSGIVKEESFYGPPNWGEDKENDQKLHYWILHLNNPLKCVTDVNNQKNGWDREIQLILSDDDYKYRRFQLNHQVTVDGKIMLAISGYHMTSVLLDDASFYSAAKK